MIVVASNDNESSQVTLPGVSICVPVLVIRAGGLKRFLTMSEVAEVEDGWIVIYPVDSAIQRLSNRGQVYKCLR